MNTASLAHGTADTRATIQSNTAVLSVDATIDVTVVAQVVTRVVDGNASAVAVAFAVTNRGNFRETFALSGTGGGTALTVASDGADAGETLSRVSLDAGSARTVFVIVPGPVAATIPVTLTATATTGHGAAGTTIAGVGAGGGDAVIGATGGFATALTTLVVDGDRPSLIKSQIVVAPDNSARVMPGSIVTYQLEARLPAATRGVALTDDIPAGTIFVAGSITLDGLVQTDGADADAASFDGSTVRVTLGDATGAVVRTVRFQARIQ